MPRVASLFLPQLAIERLRGKQRPRALPEAAVRAELPIDDDPGACSVPRGGGWRPGARWAQERPTRAETAERIAAMPVHRRPPTRELGRRSEPAAHPFRAMPSDEGGGRGRLPMMIAGPTAEAPMVLAGKVGRREVVTAACPAALALGLSPGTPVTQARALVPGLEVRPADPAADGALLDRLALHAARFWSPTAAVSGPDGIWIDLTGSAHLHGGEETFCRRAARFLARLGFTARVAVADTPGAAHAAARFLGCQHVVVAPGKGVAMLAPLPVDALRLEDAAISACRRFGLERIADLLPLPRGPLVRRLGRAAVERLDQAIGRLPEPMVPVVVEDAPVVERRLLEPVATAEAIAQIIEDLLSDLSLVLLERGLGVRTLLLELDRVDVAEQRVVVGTSRATRDARHLAKLLGLKIDRIEPGLGVEAARLRVTHAERLEAQPVASLAGDEPPQISALVDQIVGRAGAGSLFRASRVESDVPERAVRRVGPMDGSMGWPEWPRPTRLLPRPEALSSVLALLPDSPPRRFTWRGRVHDVVAGDGPERVYGEWWVRTGEVCAVRDYYRVEDRDGGRYWIFRRGDGVDGETGDLSWYVHGAFA
jgi:protein ImuB